MRRGVIIALPIIGLFLFPAPYAFALALFAAFYTPYAPLAAGIAADALYYSHGAAHWPFYSVVGAVASVAAILVRRFVETNLMR